MAVLDDGGHLIAMKREDGSEFLPQITNANAWGALGMGLLSQLLRDRAEKAPRFHDRADNDFFGNHLVAYPVA